jgi:hypothetical protein
MAANLHRILMKKRAVNVCSVPVHVQKGTAVRMEPAAYVS